MISRTVLSASLISLSVLAYPAASMAARTHAMQNAAPTEETGGCAFNKYHSSYDPTACGPARGGSSTSSGITTNAFAVGSDAMATAPKPTTGGSCDFTEYHSSWDPTHC